MRQITLISILFTFNSWCQEVDSTTLIGSQLLKEVSIEIPPLKKKEYILGTYKENTRLLGLSHGFRVNCHSEVAVYISNDNNQGIIKTILVNVRNLNKDSLYDVILYDVKLAGKRKINVPNKAIFSYTLLGDKVHKGSQMDISALKLKVPENGIFVAFRGVDFSYKTTDKITEEKTLCQIESGTYGDKWIPLKGFKKIENARFGLLMEKK